MGNYDFEEELSDSEADDSLQDDIRSLSTACMPPSDDPNLNSLNFSEDDDDDDDDDLELVRSIKEQYGIGSDVTRPLSLKPLISLPPVSDDDDDEDFQTLRAIQSRFSHYSAHPPPPHVESTNENKGVEEPLKNDYLGVESAEFNGNDIVKELFDDVQNMQFSNCTSSSSTARQTFVDAIRRNRTYQKFLRTKMLHIEARMEEIKEVQKRVKTLRDFQVHCKKKIGRALSLKQDARIQLISPPKQKSDAKGCEKSFSALGPLDNSHVAAYESAMKERPLTFHRERWSKDEAQVLQNEIKKQFQERLFQKSVDVLSALEEPGGANGVDNMILSITNLDITPDIIQEFSGKVDWNQLASTLPRRSGAECEARWLNHENCLINQEAWTTDEDKHLLLLIQKIGINSWSCIAEKLGTNRTPFQCLARYQRSLNASILKRDWTEDEDAQLRSAVEAFGGSNWQAVASVIEGRTGTQCSQRWNKTLLPARERVGKWSIDEDKRLRVASTLFGYKSWNRIANFVPGRTQAQCRERWKNVLDPSVKLGQWTKEEDMKLKTAIEKYGNCWSKVAVHVPSRTDNQCRRRWKKLFPEKVPLLEAVRRKQKVALIANFVDRESERPALGVEEFSPLLITDSTDVLGNEILSQPQNKSRKRRKANPTREFVSSCDSKGARSRKRKRSDLSAVDNSVFDEACNDNGCDTYKMKSSRKSGFKSKKASGNLTISTEQKKSNYELEWRTARGGNETDFVDAAGTTKRKKKSKSQTVDSLEWQDLPLSTLFNKAVTRIRREKSIVRPPILLTYVRRNKKGTLDGSM